MEKSLRAKYKAEFDLLFIEYIDTVNELRQAIKDRAISDETLEQALHYADKAKEKIDYILEEFRKEIET